jgi:sugar phosphate permease
MLDRYAVSTALLLGALVIVTWPVVMAASGPALPVVAILAHVCGLLAGYGVLVLLVLESRWPPLERGVGSDVLARWHSRGGRVVVGLVVLHAWGAIAAWVQSRGEGLSLAPGRSCSCRRCPPPRWARP